MKIKLLLTTLFLFASQPTLSGDECRMLTIPLPSKLSNSIGKECDGGQDNHTRKIVRSGVVYAKEGTVFYKITHTDGSVCEHMRYGKQDK